MKFVLYNKYGLTRFNDVVYNSWNDAFKELQNIQKSIGNGVYNIIIGML